MPNANLKEVLIHSASQLKIIPSNSNIILKALEMLKEENTSISQIAGLIKNDLGVSSKILNIANSAFFRIGMPVNTVEKAVMNLGVRELKSILFCLYYLNIFSDFLNFKKSNLHYMLNHSIFVALSTRLLSQKMGIEEPEEVFTISLLHDIGKIVFFMNIEWYGKLIEEAELKRESLADMEKDKFGIDHQETGYILGLKWKLPEIFLHVIKHHHSCEITDDASYYILKFIQEADRFFYYRDGGISPESYILNKDKENLLTETDNLLSILEH